MTENLPPLPIPTAPVVSPLNTSIRAAYAKACLDTYLRAKLSAEDPTRNPNDTLPPPEKVTKTVADGAWEKTKDYAGDVCIVGAGVSGLYVAMMLKYLGIKNVDILEASNKVGGRCYTYSFPGNPSCKHNYYDVGAMRIPDIPTMKSTLKLIEILDMEDNKQEYVYNLSYDLPHMYNYNHMSKPDGSKYEDAIKDIVNKLSVDFHGEFRRLTDGDDDNYSTRSWLMIKKGSTGLFDQAFVESLCDYSDFQLAKEKPWYRIDQGMATVPEAMSKYLSSKTGKFKDGSPIINVTFNAPVVAMGMKGNKIEVTRTDECGKTPQSKNYDMVFNTTAMAPLQRMDLSKLGLGHDILLGIRALSYDRASKVAIKFKSRWWKSMYKKKGDVGGISGTDLPISNVVYPSWDDGTDEEGNDYPAVLMVSYSWAQDATRIGALIPDYTKVTPSQDDPIVTLCLKDLVLLWAEQDDPPSLEFLQDQYVAHHAWAWSHDQYTGGAFALFGPGQFKHLYPKFHQIFCDKKFIMCGEALSAHHAWISGALDSAYVAVHRWLLAIGREDLCKELERSYFGPGENKNVEELDKNLAEWAVKLSGAKEPEHKVGSLW
ncbi:putative bolA-like protein [Colletotrichum spaethianum]|uniref:BolA-like protein n=1 Tax=Colletotrichum spaethianum TaxID=700344 RepID=A0AA37URZ6_9PEZI|nr:putative bolA-like protein [Colletotrichum spaethianum]GKT49023.1 putative bolA-like protein [Colletotrichum spaethianum]